MQRVILFRFHANPIICKNRLILLKKFNPGVSIFGLFGGEEKKYPEFKNKLKPYLKNIYCVRGKTGFWKRLNGDLAVRLWYQVIGKTLSFDMLHVVEWDLLFFDSLNRIYSDIPEGCVGLAALTALKNVENKWALTSKEPYKSQWQTLLKFAQAKFSYRQEPFASQGPGPCLPRSFLEKYSNTEIPDLGNDELRLPLFSQIFGFKLYDTGLQKKWFDKEEEKFFNCDKVDIRISTIKKELSLLSGKRAFHPFRKLIALNCGDQMINILIATTESTKLLVRKIFRS
jgi:hypothetical protein